MFKSILKSVSLLVLLATQSLSLQAETRGFVVDMMHTATYADPRNCPEGGNGHYGHTRLRTFKALGLSQEKIDYYLSGKVRLISLPMQHLVTMRVKKDGELVSAYHYPELAKLPPFKTVAGPNAYGFDLDGKETAEDFTDPDTGARGVDNELFRTVGCFELYGVGFPARPFYEETVWTTRNVKIKPQSWAFTISSDNLNADGEATVRFYNTVEHVRMDTSGQGLADMTYVIDPGARTHGELHGVLKDGVFVADQPQQTVLLERQSDYMRLDLTEARLRLKLNEDRTAAGFMAGYRPWMDFWFMLAAGGEQDHGLDIAGIYQMLKSAADGRPDPETGLNTSISGTYRIEAVPAFLATSDGHFITDAH